MVNVRSAHTALFRGVYYRSRLEACWASFFHAHQIEFEYERRYFTFDDGTKYQPDFWLIHSRAWFEVKGALSDEDAEKISNLARASVPRDELVLMGGAPAGYMFGSITAADQFDPNCVFGRCAYCDTWTIACERCRNCGFIEMYPGRSTYIDVHRSHDLNGCVSRCDILGGVHTWKNNSPVPDSFRGEMHQWASDSLEQFSKFKIVRKRNT